MTYCHHCCSYSCYHNMGDYQRYLQQAQQAMGNNLSQWVQTQVASESVAQTKNTATKKPLNKKLLLLRR